MSLIFGQDEIIGMLSMPVQNDRRAVAVIDEQCRILCANSAFHTHLGLCPGRQSAVSINDVLPVNVRFAYQDFITNDDMLSTHMEWHLLSDGLTIKRPCTLSFSKLNVEKRVLSLLILHADDAEAVTPAVSLQ